MRCMSISSSTPNYSGYSLVEKRIWSINEMARALGKSGQSLKNKIRDVNRITDVDGLLDNQVVFAGSRKVDYDLSNQSLEFSEFFVASKIVVLPRFLLISSESSV